MYNDPSYYHGGNGYATGGNHGSGGHFARYPNQHNDHQAHSQYVSYGNEFYSPPSPTQGHSFPPRRYHESYSQSSGRQHLNGGGARLTKKWCSHCGSQPKLPHHRWCHFCGNRLHIDYNGDDDLIVIQKGLPPTWLANIADQNAELLPAHIINAMPKRPPKPPEPVRPSSQLSHLPKPPEPPQRAQSPSTDDADTIDPDMIYLGVKYSDFSGSIDFQNPPPWFTEVWKNASHPLVAEIIPEFPPKWLLDVSTLPNIVVPRHILDILVLAKDHANGTANKTFSNLEPPPSRPMTHTSPSSTFEPDVASQWCQNSLAHDYANGFVFQGFEKLLSSLGQDDIVSNHAKVLKFITSSTTKVDEIDDVISQFKKCRTLLNQNKAMAIQNKKAIEASPKWLNRESPPVHSQPQTPEEKKMVTLAALLSNLANWPVLNKEAASLLKSASTMLSPGTPTPLTPLSSTRSGSNPMSPPKKKTRIGPSDPNESSHDPIDVDSDEGPSATQCDLDKILEFIEGDTPPPPTLTSTASSSAPASSSPKRKSKSKAGN